ncbi:RNA polymerase sigma factor [Jiulongibacter sediminis]|uniref:RNA polymerase sigma-70 region 2 domain-containing protein n=1 Tax=Jiulongibacter sediminis TaxID=1605367 RepID=A0A0P7C4Q9_9BACT|nr:RNA polymerase sigma factor [Jiulongibacter sediminis]KPM48245.1 hypothetical protein AFM12_06180 [Jiulongibacter sediminis]TBX24787.1 hypothetical protein TK44_06185 [Jiulongibacter sediminis]
MPQNAALSEEEVLLRIQSNHQINSAVSWLYARYYDRLETLILRNSGSADDAADIIQETMIAFINIVQQGKFRGESGVNTFLQSIARNLWLGKLRKGKSQAKLHENWGEEAKQESVDLEKELQYKEATDLVSGIFKNLGEACQKLLNLFYFKELSMKEILPEMNFENEQVLRNKKTKCMKSLMAEIKQKPVWAETLKSALQKLR